MALLGNQEVEQFSKQKHEGQFRRDGKTPYFTHVRRVADRAILRVDTDVNKRQIEQVALLHDILEDNRANVVDIMALNLLPNVFEAVRILTHDPDDDYLDYIQEIKFNFLARQVKIADILDNLSDNPREKQIIKYARALLILMDKGQ